MSAAIALPAGPVRAFRPSALQSAFLDEVANGTDNIVLEAVAGSGKSTTIVRALPLIPRGEPVLILAFNVDVVGDMKKKVTELGLEVGRDFRDVRVSTFHALSFGALSFRMGRSFKFTTDGHKSRKLAEQLWSEETCATYADFACELVGYAKGLGVGTRLQPTWGREDWEGIVDHHDMLLPSEEADLETAVNLARELLRRSNEVAKKDGLIDYDDMLYLPILWKCRFFQQAWVFVDEAQDTSPVRREIAAMALRPGGRLVAVGDRRQAIYGFTGASADALDQIAAEFRAKRMPLNVSYRCPHVAVDLVKKIAPEFEAHEDAIEGTLLRLTLADAIKVLEPTDAVLCRNVAPLVSLAFRLIALKVPCRVLGREIGAGLRALVKRMRAKTIDGLVEKLVEYRTREVEKFKKERKDMKAQAVEDRVECILTFVAGLDEKSRTVPKLLASIDGAFSDEKDGKRLTLSSCHKAKGREWKRVAVLRPDLSPSAWARQPWAQEQEDNLMYVRDTRFTDTHITLLDDGSVK